MLKTQSKKVYKMKDEISHILDRPDMYVGSKRLKTSEEFCLNFISVDDFNIIKKEVTYPPALLRIFIEIISNAVDNVQRSKESNNICKSIKVNINKETGETSVWNDGEVIPIEKNEEHDMYNHTMVFGHLRTGENYDDDENRFVSGRNGLGSKATCVFSSIFTVKGVDPKNHKVLEQTWTENMRKTNGPKIKATKVKTGYTEVTYVPDFSQFGIKEYTDDIISLYSKYVVDVALLTNVKVYLNNKLLKVPNLQSYSKLYNTTDIKKESLFIETDNSEVLVTTSDNGFQSISFVNGIYTKNGGNHVESFSEALFRPIVKKINDKNKSKLTISDVKSYFKIFVVSVVSKPEFDSQEKHTLTYPKIDVKIDKKDLDKLLKWKVVKEIENYVKLKSSLSLSKVEKKTTNFVKIEKLDDAHNAGTKKGYECCLVVTEGDSAKTFAILGLEKGLYDKKGRGYIGVMSLFGKPLNVRNASIDTISKNKVITNLIGAIGLKQGVDYTIDDNWKKLRYGRFVSLCDADSDGIAISSLLLNFFHFLYPSLLKRKPSFFVNMCTPIVRVHLSKNNDILFYDEQKFKIFSKTKTSEWLKKNSQYYKGLGSSDNKDVKELFGKKLLEFESDDNMDNSMIKVFDKKFSDNRKQWLELYNPDKNKPYNIDDINSKIIPISITDFLENETITFSWANCKRSIPHLMDGLKESQRKAVFGCKKARLYNNKPPMKVSQFASYVSKETSYHHGEQSLCDTIVKMAQKFVGSNNIPLFDRKGNFGSRRLTGDDAAQSRYIFTRQDTLTEVLFKKEDEPLLNYINEDGDDVEPSFFVPVLPMILINGSIGLGSGWSSSVPCFNPLDIVDCVRIWIKREEKMEKESLSFPDILPWYRNFTGSIVKDKEKFICTGSIKRIDDNIVEVNEIPIDISIDKFKIFLEELCEKKVIQSFKNNSTTEKPNFIITEYKDGLKCSIENLKLSSYIHVTNMVLFNGKEKLKKYSVNEIIDEFCKTRLDYYKKRKVYMINLLEKELIHLQNKLNFINDNIEGNIDLRNINEDEIILKLKELKYDQENNNYDYLLNMPIRSLSKNMFNKLTKEFKDKEKELLTVRNKKETNTWLYEIDEFVSCYTDWIKIIDKN